MTFLQVFVYRLFYGTSRKALRLVSIFILMLIVNTPFIPVKTMLDKDHITKFLIVN
ncbi:hypothetical protein [Oceanobacillus iheyensis HTE831]|uniref:Uncharacterized protein n=1 Tax=Oceanobacillus iheyensis (strain DSM 14371 / CIP 107618 / JCM 11309 / KCTC 3954 / HTE831) TaxID=221109 RepID=Q8EM68_OCEIH|nr:hypothetical protein [Oceanobacillus iheyensis HTE831]